MKTENFKIGGVKNENSFKGLHQKEFKAQGKHIAQKIGGAIRSYFELDRFFFYTPKDLQCY